MAKASNKHLNQFAITKEDENPVMYVLEWLEHSLSDQYCYYNYYRNN